MITEKGYCRTSLGQIHYTVSGSGAPTLLLPEGGRSARMYASLVPELARHYKVITFDTPGCGGSAPLNPGTTFEDIADAFRECLAALGFENINLYGMHTGNKLGAALAVRSPGLVRRFVCAGQSHSIVPDMVRRNALIGEKVKKVLSDAPPPAPLHAWIEHYGELSAKWLSRESIDDADRPDGPDRNLDRIIDYLLSLKSKKSLYEANRAYDLGRDLQRLAVPTLILEVATAEEDRDVGRQGEILRKMISGSELVTLELPDDEGHTLERRTEALVPILTKFFG